MTLFFFLWVRNKIIFPMSLVSWFLDKQIIFLEWMLRRSPKWGCERFFLNLGSHVLTNDVSKNGPDDIWVCQRKEKLKCTWEVSYQRQLPCELFSYVSLFLNVYTISGTGLWRKILKTLGAMCWPGIFRKMLFMRIMVMTYEFIKKLK